MIRSLHPCLSFISMPGGSEWLIIAMLGLLFFGKRLPEVARSFGRSVTEFKKGLSDLDSEIDTASTRQEIRRLPAEPAPPAERPAETSAAPTNELHQP